MSRNRLASCVLLIVFGLVLDGISITFGQSPDIGSESRRESASKLQQLKDELSALGDVSVQDRADAEIFLKGLEWALRFDHDFTDADLAIQQRCLEQAAERIACLKSGSRPWREKIGSVALGYQSQVDDSIQPLGLIVPQQYDASRAMRLDVVLHGSSAPVGMSELRFIDRFLKPKVETSSDAQYLELHPLGRVENCYRWSGETDVFEAIEEVCRRYNVDRNLDLEI